MGGLRRGENDAPETDEHVCNSWCSIYPLPLDFHADMSLLPKAGIGLDLLLLSPMVAIVQVIICPKQYNSKERAWLENYF